MHRRNVIVVGASAGGVEALLGLARGLPAELPATLVVVLHVSPHHHSVLPRMLTDAGNLPAQHVRDRERFKTGRIYVAPPNQHVLMEDTLLRLSRGPHENGSRPA